MWPEVVSVGRLFVLEKAQRRGLNGLPHAWVNPANQPSFSRFIILNGEVVLGVGDDQVEAIPVVAVIVTALH
jgi:hypothetical protein